jgi:hypothetical protein
VKKATLSTLSVMILFSLFAPRPAFTQTSSTQTSSPARRSESTSDFNMESKSEKELNRGLAAGKACLDYTFDVASLVDNDHRIFWKRGDCIRVHVTNNPFLFKYSLQFNEQLIKEDDPLSAFGGMFGLNVSNVTNPSGGATSHNVKDDQAHNAAAVNASVDEAAKNAYSEIAAQPVPPETKGFLSLQVENFSKDLEKPQIAGSLEQKEQTLKQYQGQVDKANINKAQKDQAKQTLQEVANAVQPANPPSSDDVNKLVETANRVQHLLPLLTDEYRKFSQEVQGRLAVLRNVATPLDKVSKVATKLRDDSNAELACLTNAQFDADYTKLLGCPQNVNSDPSDTLATQSTVPSEDCTGIAVHTLNCQLLTFAKQAPPVHTSLVKSMPAVTSDLDKVHDAAAHVAYGACVYQAFIESDLDSIRTGLIAPLSSVISDGFAFGYPPPYASYEREGPDIDPTSVTMTLKREPISPFTTDTGASKILEYTTDSYTCSGDPEDVLTNGSSYKSLGDFFTDKPAQPETSTPGTATIVKQATANLYMRNQNKPVLSGKTTSTTAGHGPDSTGGKTPSTTKPATTDAASTVVLVQPWLFGKPRLVLSGGVGTALLSKQEFQRSMSISGGTTDTVVGLKTNTKIRTTPMLYGHTFLPWLDRRHDPDAWYATFGVTANSDNKGTDPEFLFGLSRSFVQQRFFVTAGAYLGERQKLDGGLYVGEVIPSTFTTDLPVTKSYHTGFSFGISYRFTSTKTAQNNAKQAPGGSTKTGK